MRPVWRRRRCVFSACFIILIIITLAAWSLSLSDSDVGGPREPRFFLLVAQGRSGSTALTRALAAAFPNSFVIAEPFRNWDPAAVGQSVAAGATMPTYASLFDCSFLHDPQTASLVSHTVVKICV